MGVHNPQRKVEEIFNKDHESDIKYALQQTRWILTSIGIWNSVTSKPTTWQSRISDLMLPLCPIAIAILLVPILCYVVLEDGQIIVLFGVIDFQTGCLVKIFILIYRRDGIKICVEHIEANWRRLRTPNDRDIMMRNLKIGRYITTSFCAGVYGSSMLWLTVPYFMDSYVNAQNQSVRPLPYPGADIFVNTQAGFNYEILYLTSLICTCFELFVHMAVFNLALVFVTHSCGQFQIVMSRLENLVGSTEDNVTIDNRIEFIIRTHVRSMRFSSDIEEILRDMCLVEVVSIGLLLCWIEYWGLMEWQNNHIMGSLQQFLLFLAYSSNLFVFCHVGELLQEECQKIGKTSYMIEWYKLPGKTGLALVLIMAMSNYPCKLTAGRMLDLSYYSFGSIIKTTFAYLNMMRTMAA